MVVSDNRTQ